MVARHKTLKDLQARIGITFDKTALLEESLTHSSFVNEYPELKLPDSQRLEFLGDAILDFVVGEWLYLRYPDAREGELTRLRTHVVRTESLAAFAGEIDLGSCLRLGRGEAHSGGESRPANLCATFEALVGAIYLDQGMKVTRRWIHGILEDHQREIDSQSKDAKSLLQEHAQAHLHTTPSYRVVREEGPDHAKVFTAQAVITDRIQGEGRGASKQAAEQAAAEAALRALNAAHESSPQ